ncbi:MAG: bifunctional oligoribonuclease/PAP phosphatase NrnA [Candidatus Omnitrophica bacterium]|nr:bifunctional oligoribonuclease/PAP phosphatase NrnA [Candidatus Omnitrophota bacterium]
MKTDPFKAIVDKITRGRKFLITAHMNLEGDALGSELATYILLKKLKKQAVIYNNDPTPEIYNFLPFSRVIKNNLAKEDFDVAIALDCSDSSRTGKVKDSLVKANCIINIDHHVSNTYFGDINWVEPRVGSCAQILYRLCKKFGVIDKNIALCLYTGIFTDTGNFTYASTDDQTHRIASELMKYNLHPHILYDRLHSVCTPLDLNFIGKVISTLKFDPAKKICWANIVHWQDKGYDLTEVVFSIMRLLKGVEVSILFKKIDNKRTRVNFRSRSCVDVNKIARFFGGGGHKRASGTTIDSSLEAAEKKVVSFIKKHTNSSLRRPA